jgi:hypothetical protein
MADKLQIIITGADRMIRTLEGLPAAVERRVLRNALRAAARPMREAAKGTAPKMSGLLGASIGLGPVHWYASSGTMYVAVGARSGFARQVGEVSRKRAFGVRTSRMEILGKGGKSSGMVLSSRKQNPRKYAHLAERGRKGVEAKSGKALYLYQYGAFLRRVGPAAGTHFMAKAFAATQGAMRQILETQILSGVEREANSLSGSSA